MVRCHSKESLLWQRIPYLLKRFIYVIINGYAIATSILLWPLFLFFFVGFGSGLVANELIYWTQTGKKYTIIREALFYIQPTNHLSLPEENHNYLQVVYVTAHDKDFGLKSNQMASDLRLLRVVNYFPVDSSVISDLRQWLRAHRGWTWF